MVTLIRCCSSSHQASVHNLRGPYLHKHAGEPFYHYGTKAKALPIVWPWVC